MEGLAVAGLRRLGVDNPEHILIDRENYAQLLKSVRGDLSSSEMEVFNLMLSGLGYKEIATILGKESKSVDNAISRVKTKARKYIAV